MTSPNGGFPVQWRIVLDLPPESRLRLVLSFDRDLDPEASTWVLDPEASTWDLAGHVVATDLWFKADVELSTNLAQLKTLGSGLSSALDGAPATEALLLGTSEDEGLSLGLRTANPSGWIATYSIAQWFYIGPEADDVTRTRLTGDAWIGRDHLSAFHDRIVEVIRLLESGS